MRAVACFALLFVGASSCDPPPVVTCEPACAAAAPACDDGCPAIADAVCVDGSCEDVADGDLDLAITVSIDRGIADSVVALAIAVVDARVSSCDDVGPVKDADAVVAGNRIEVAGGPFHPDLRVGLVPAGDYLVVADALDAAGAVLRSGCDDIALTADGSITLGVGTVVE